MKLEKELKCQMDWPVFQLYLLCFLIVRKAGGNSNYKRFIYVFSILTRENILRFKCQNSEFKEPDETFSAHRSIL